ncbi:hypothetical protein GLOTRDRAFT_139455 [Gloeophyllum trabeum ATCC 11539]|uniref:Uncharacterized protein n=1 Tax=Gloeophyllum trabeum (strain ATCC 11539 / FP-39264 / Madison 617) TaxID=670483 RepID=S7Q1Z6_GLOTA|nr:uncharacterized protein GLOTRDRAFT_139455 [Gloeophyllum trabeum ATCC 11539]EPQ54041.1 hypothetical protein GLOTRDRAFT_139455 [Gloeophyllum trabeum ATCC 11539]
MVNLNVAASLVLAALTAPYATAAPADVWAPPITYPTDSTIWQVGWSNWVAWDTSNPPAHITNPNGTIYLVWDGEILFEDPGPLASGFSLMDGYVYFDVPNVTASNEWRVVLIGDSGDVSPPFALIQ